MTDLPMPNRPTVQHEPLLAHAEQVKRLQATIDELRQQTVRANTRAETAEAARDDYLERLDVITERYRVANTLLAEVVAPTRKEVRTLSQRIGNPEDREKADAELAVHLSQGWEKFDCTIIARELTFRYVTLVREVPAPQPEREIVTSLVTVVPNSQMTITAVPTVNAYTNAQQRIADSDARVQAAAPFSPFTQAFVDYMKVQP